MTAARDGGPVRGSFIGGRILEALAETPRLNGWIYSKLAPNIRGEVLEIGSGIGNLSRLIVDQATRAIFSDVEPHYLAELRRGFATDSRVTVTHYDLALPPPPEIANRRFDTIVVVNVIEHIADDRAATATLAGLLNPGGKLVLYVPACPFAYGSLDRALGHYRRYTPDSLTALLSGAGLRPEIPAYMNFFGLLGWILNGRLLRSERLSRRQLRIFERLVPLLRFEDFLRLPVGLGISTFAQKPPDGSG
ncbi:MAG TPA: class I SAM-dependent methyltransferase [Polyangia bacterium]|nr:class I SAM-dependent methyltransferase [Polyangia bacterium]